MDRTRLAYVSAAVVGAGTAVIFVWWWWARRQRHRAPKKWRKVGELSDLICFPVKSLGPIRLNEMECTVLGLRSGWLRDRTLMVIDLDGQFVTGRQLPRMVQVSPSVAGSILTLKAPGMMSVSVDLSRLRGRFRAAVWGQAVPACDCGEEVARWLSRFLLQEDTGLRLVYYPLDKPARDVRGKNKPFPLTESFDTGAYPDATSYTLQSETSIADLNSRLEESVTPLNFRPNFVVKGAEEPYEEDSWDWIKIGQVVFRNVKPCTRCIFTTVNPENGIKNPKVEPLKTLKKYRQITDPELRPHVLDSPVLGIHLGLRGQSGMIRLGDSVYVGESDEQPPLVSPP